MAHSHSPLPPEVKHEGLGTKGLTIKQYSDIEYVQKQGLSIDYPDLSCSEALKVSDLETLKCRREKFCKKDFHQNARSQPQVKLHVAPRKNSQQITQIHQ